MKGLLNISSSSTRTRAVDSSSRRTSAQTSASKLVKPMMLFSNVPPRNHASHGSTARAASLSRDAEKASDARSERLRPSSASSSRKRSR